MVSVIAWHVPNKSVLVIPCTNNTEKEMMFSADVSVRCPYRRRNTEDISKVKPSLDACLLVCFYSKLPEEERFACQHETFPTKCNSMNTEHQNVRPVMKSQYIKKNTSYSSYSVIVRLRKVLKELSLKMTSAQVVETSITKKPPFRNTLTQTITL